MTNRKTQQASQPRLPALQPRFSLLGNSSATPLTATRRDIQLFPVSPTRPRQQALPRSRRPRPTPWPSVIAVALALAGIAAAGVAANALRTPATATNNCTLL